MNKVWTLITDHKIEAGALIIIICAIIFFTFAVHSCIKNINEAGGLRAVVVEAGKETKLIANDINEAVEKHYESERNEPYR